MVHEPSNKILLPDIHDKKKALAEHMKFVKNVQQSAHNKIEEKIRTDSSIVSHLYKNSPQTSGNNDSCQQSINGML